MIGWGVNSLFFNENKNNLFLIITRVGTTYEIDINNI